MRFADTTCKLCGTKVVARWPDDAPQDWVDRLAPMLVCNPCADSHRKKNDAQSEILTKCFSYARLSTSDQGKEISRLRSALLILTRSYADAVAYIARAPAVVWSEDFVDILISKPEQAGRTLREYRRSIEQEGEEP